MRVLLKDMPSRDPATGKRLSGAQQRRRKREVQAPELQAPEVPPVPARFAGLPSPPATVSAIEAWAAGLNLCAAVAAEDSADNAAPRVSAVIGLCRELGRLSVKAARSEKALRLRRLRLGESDALDPERPPVDDPAATVLWAYRRLALLAWRAAVAPDWRPDPRQAAAAKAREKAAEKARKEGERRDKMGLLERMGVTPHNIWVASHSMNVISKSIGAVGAVGGAIKNVVGGIAGKAMEVGQGLFESVVDAAQFRQNALTGLEYMLGSRKEAEDMFAYAQKYAQETPLDTDKVLGGMKALITQGFSGDEAKLLYKVVADQQSKYMDDSTMQDKVIAAFSRVQGRGKATGEDLESFRVAGFRAEGIVQELLKNEDLAPLWKKIKRQGMDGGKSSFVSQDKATQEEILKEVQAAMGEGRVGKYTLMNAAIASLEDGHDDIGEFAKKSGKNSLTGTISNVKALWGDLLKSVNIQDWPGIQSLQAFLARVVEDRKSVV